LRPGFPEQDARVGPSKSRPGELISDLRRPGYP